MVQSLAFVAHFRHVIVAISEAVPTMSITVMIAEDQQTTPMNTRVNDRSVCGLLISAMNKTVPKVNATAVMQLASAVSFSQLPRRAFRTGTPVRAAAADNITPLITVNATRISNAAHNQSGVRQETENFAMPPNMAR